MLFNSFQFIVFFPVVVSVYFIIPERIKNYWLLVASIMIFK